MNEQFMKNIRVWWKSIDRLQVSLSWCFFQYADSLQKAIEQKREEVYEEEVKKWKKIWDSNLYRVDDMLITDDCCHILLGIMQWSQLFVVKYCEDLFTTVEENQFPNGIACGVLIETSDDTFLFWQRSNTSAWRSGGEIALVWWTLQPDEWVVQSYQWFYSHILRELEEEIWILQSHIVYSKIIGIQRMQNGWIGFAYYTKLSISASEANKFFLDRTDDEMKNLLSIPRGEVIAFLYERCYKDWVLTRTLWLACEYLIEIFKYTTPSVK